MTRDRKKLLLPLIMPALVACSAQVWVKPGATQSDFQIVKGHCVAESYSRVQVAPTQLTIGAGYTNPIYTNCTGTGYSIGCVSSGGGYVPAPTIQYDANARARDEVFRGCMYGQGWNLAEKSDLHGQSSTKPTNPTETLRFDVRCKIPGQEAIGFVRGAQDCTDVLGEVIP